MQLKIASCFKGTSIYYIDGWRLPKKVAGGFMKTVNDYLIAISDYPFRRINNALSVHLEFEGCVVYLHHDGNERNDFKIKVRQARLIPNSGKKELVGAEPRDLRNWLDSYKDSYEMT